MNMNFGKHFASMYEGSLIGAGSVVFAVMGYVISNQKPQLGEGGEKLVVTLNPRMLGMILGDGEQAVREAIDFLCKEDEESQSKEEKGKRLVKLGEFDYWVVNGRYYRDLGVRDRRKEQNRAAQARHREKKRLADEVSGAARNRERRFVKALKSGKPGEADAIAAENLPKAKLKPEPEPWDEGSPPEEEPTPASNAAPIDCP